MTPLRPPCYFSDNLATSQAIYCFLSDTTLYLPGHLGSSQTTLVPLRLPWYHSDTTLVPLKPSWHLSDHLGTSQPPWYFSDNLDTSQIYIGAYQTTLVSFRSPWYLLHHLGTSRKHPWYHSDTTLVPLRPPWELSDHLDTSQITLTHLRSP